MKKINLFAILFAIVSVLFFAGCDNNNDKKDGDTNPPVEDCFCDEAKTVACPDGGKDACEKPAVCDPACADDKECKCEAGKCECVDKVEPACTCDPACDAEKQDCAKSDDGKCGCVDKAPVEEKPAEECKCEDNSACPDNDKAKCAKPVDDPCKDKAENADCGENKTCQKGEGDKLECKEKPAPTEEKKCDSACKDNQECVCEKDKCECKDKANEPCFCDEEKKVACPEGCKDACPKDDKPTE